LLSLDIKNEQEPNRKEQLEESPTVVYPENRETGRLLWYHTEHTEAIYATKYRETGRQGAIVVPHKKVKGI
jgi:hypothetical protein